MAQEANESDLGNRIFEKVQLLYPTEFQHAAAEVRIEIMQEQLQSKDEQIANLLRERDENG